MDEDIFSEAKNEVNLLSRTPVSFIVFGKPGCGKTTLAKRLASVWKCQLINEAIVVEELLKEDSQLSAQVAEILTSGKELDEDFVGELLTRKLDSPETRHYGYVLDCFPSYKNEWKTIEEQMEFIKSLNQPPNVIINMKIPDVDLLKRRVGQKVDPLSNEVFIKETYDPSVAKTDKKDNENDEEDDEEDEEEEELEEEDNEELEDEYAADLADVNELQLLAPDIADRLVNRKSDESLYVESEIDHYKNRLLRHIEDYIIEHNRQLVIELDASLQPKQLFRSLLVYLTSLGLPRAAAPKRLMVPEEGEEEDETIGMDTEQFLAQLSGTGTLDSHFRWRRTKWGKYCPVELSKGNIAQGKIEFSVGLLDKMYCLSSLEALALFYKSPRTYLLPPNPRIPCKTCILGPPSSGKSLLASRLAKHFNATVLDLNELIAPVVQKAMGKAIYVAREKAKSDEIARLTIEQDAMKNNTETTEELPPITEDHPEVQAAMKKAEEQVKPAEANPDLYVEAMEEGVRIAERQRKEDITDGRKHGGWIVDGFPFIRNHWPIMIDANLLPDSVVILESPTKDKDLLLKRFCKDNKLGDPSEWEKGKTTSEESGSGSKSSAPTEVNEWNKKYNEFNQQWIVLCEAIKGSSIDPISVDYSLTPDEIMSTVVEKVTGVFQLPAVEPDEEAEMDDDLQLNEEEEPEEEVDEMSTKTRKPWGDTSFYCPVALKDQGVLWPGNLDTSIRYRDRLYVFSTDEAKDKFVLNPSLYVASDTPLKTPATRIFLLGAKGSGKTTIGQKLAAKWGLFHVSFHHYLQDQVMPKMRKPPLVDKDEYEYEDKVENTGDEDPEDDVIEGMSDKENEILAYLLHGEQLKEEHLEEILAPFWNSEPYQSTGIILEGFPTHGDEIRFMCSKGYFPDVVAVLDTEDNDTIERLMPKKMEIWRRKREKLLKERKDARNKVISDWEQDMAKRKAEIEDDYKQKKAEMEDEMKEDGSDEEGSDPFYDDYREQLMELEAEEPPEEEEFEEETEEDFEERTLTALRDKHEEQMDSISGVKDVLAELQVPCHYVPAGKKISIVFYCIEKVLLKFISNREGLLTKTSAITKPIAKKLLDHGYKQLSKFGYWCPVKLMEDTHSILPPLSSSSTVPTIYRGHIYYISSSAQNKFSANPEKYLHQKVPHIPIPIRIAVLGPPKSGKTTIANRFCAEYGCLRLSTGEAVRRLITDFPNSDLACQIQVHLKQGQTIPEELVVLALERMLLDVQCSTRGYVLDGWPTSKAQVSLLNKYRIIPVSVVELTVSNELLLKRAELDRNTIQRSYIMNDSPSILMVKSSAYYKHLDQIKDWYSTQHTNWHTVDGEKNHWHVWRDCERIAIDSALQIQQYLVRVTQDKAASIHDLCITPTDFKLRLSKYESYCPVCLKNAELVECPEHEGLMYAVEYKGYYYRTCGKDHCQKLIEDPLEYLTDPTSSTILPPPEQRPRRVSEEEIKTMFPKKYELNGFCPVTYVDGKQRFESLIPGLPNCSLVYKDKLYCCVSQEAVNKFHRCPHKYDKCVLPHKLPPPKQPFNIPSLPMLGYMEQTVATGIINSLTAAGSFKPKIPFLTASQSAQIYVALHLKAYNVNASIYSREKYRNKLRTLEEKCKLVSWLMRVMERGYTEPQKRTTDFENNMSAFLALEAN